MIAIKTFSKEHVDENIKLGASEYTSQEVLNKEHLIWKHILPPAGPSKFIGEYSAEGALTGRIFLQRRNFYLKDNLSATGATATDLLIDPKCRVASSFIAITRSIKSPEEIDIIFHTSNENSDIFYRNLFKFPVRFSLTALGLPVDIYEMVKSKWPNLSAIKALKILSIPYKTLLVILGEILTNFTKINFSNEPIDQENIFSQFKKRAGPHFERSKEFNYWRFNSGPIFNGAVYWAWKGKECLGYLVFKKTELKHINFYVLMDIIFIRDLGRLEKICIKFLMVKIAIQNNCDALFMMVNLKNSSLNWLKGAPFFKIPDRCLPHATPIFIHTKLPENMLHKYENIFFTLADLDYF
ncbi:hypothetical protein [Polynucleobacter hallstattensis]|uniref:hypothetical protein n=1 Tax=Polynucleobacter hallstattensis TaxID=1855586 RepID=UPI001C0B8076|nr:hypothetical protein [Polynucleobacter hallstattensis]MBU3560595.1 hypothetical protein [Polynucleobacter hallstattensis]